MKFEKFTIKLFTAVTIFFCAFTLKTYAAIDINRLSGDDRYETAINISKYSWADGSSEIAFLATGEDFPDALCAAPLARKYNAPILLNGNTSLDTRVGDELKRLGAKTVYIVGGISTISLEVQNEIENMKIKCYRVQGEDRYETSIEIAKLIGNFSEVVIAADSDFPDVLSIAPIAAKKGMPIILSPKDALPDSVTDYLTGKYITNAYIIGGVEVLSNSVAQQVPSINAPKRLYGMDRYETNIAIINAFSNELNYDTVFVATGDNFPDALAGSAAAPKSSSPIILVGNTPTVTTKHFIALNIQYINKIKALGGEGAVSSTTLQELTKIDTGDKYNDFSLRYSADYRVKVYDNVYWVPANTLGKPKLTREEILGLARDSEILRKNINTLYDAIQYVRAVGFKSADDNAYIEEDGSSWEHHKPAAKAIVSNEGCYATISNLANYLLKDDYEETGFIQYFQEDGTGYAFNYIKHAGKYYVFDMTHYKNDFRYTAVETGNIKDYYNSDYIAGNIHETDSLENYIAYCRKKYNDPAELYVVYSAEYVLPNTVKKVNGSTYICYPADKKEIIKAIYDSTEDGLLFDFIEGPKKLPSWI